jgi:Tfp pilus assembly protein PilX
MKPLSRPSHVPQGLPSRQKGAILLIGMSILIVVTLFALAAIRGITAQERIAGGFYDREISFAAAESALHYAERKFMAQDPPFMAALNDRKDPVCDTGNTALTCPQSVPNTAEYFKEVSYSALLGQTAYFEPLPPASQFSNTKAGEAAGQPLYLAVKLRDGGECGNAVRINGIGVGRNDKTLTVLETIVCKPS